jgi:hypothetical protein
MQGFAQQPQPSMQGFGDFGGFASAPQQPAAPSMQGFGYASGPQSNGFGDFASAKPQQAYAAAPVQQQMGGFGGSFNQAAPTMNAGQGFPQASQMMRPQQQQPVQQQPPASNNMGWSSFQ